MVSSTEVCISEEEAALYDRQLRLWGVEAQNRLKRSRILLLGMTPLAAELAKNLVLVGIQSLTVVDDVLATEEDVSCNFLIPCEAVGKPRSTAALPRIQALNSMVRVSALSAGCNNPIQEGHTYDVVILTSSCLESDISNWIALKNNLRKSTGQVPGAHIVLASTMAFFGVAFLDLGYHEFMAEEVLPKKRPAPSATGVKKSQAASGTESTFVKKVARYSDLQDCLDMTWSSTGTCPSLSPKSMPKGFLLLEVLRRCTIADLPLNVEFLKSVWTSVSATLGVDSGFLSDEEFACCCGAPSPSVNAVLGGVVAQEIVRSPVLGSTCLLTELARNCSEPVTAIASSLEHPNDAMFQFVLHFSKSDKHLSWKRFTYSCPRAVRRKNRMYKRYHYSISSLSGSVIDAVPVLLSSGRLRVFCS